MVHYPRNGDDIDRGLIGYWKLDDLKRVPTDGIVAHYKMNDDAADRVVIDSKGGNNGVSANNTDTMSAVGKINESLEFNGVDDSITLSNMQDFPENFTICMWIYDDQNIGGDEFGNFMNGGAYGAAENYGIQFGKPGASDSTDVRFNFRTSTPSSVSINSSITADTLTHFMITKNGNNLEMFKNNVSAGTTTTDGAEFKRNYNLDLGSQGGNNFFAGREEDVRIYNRALSSGERAAVYNSGNGTETTELFRDTVVAIDRANFNDGQIIGATNTTGINGINPDAMFFDGIDDAVQIVHNANLIDPINENQAITMAGWIYRKAGSNVVIRKGSDATGYLIRTPGGNLGSLIEVSGGTVGASSGDLTDEVWTHVAVTYDGTTLIHYIDGENVHEEIDVQTILITNTTSLNIGKRTTDEWFYGRMQKLRLYSRALTSNQVKKLYRLKK